MEHLKEQINAAYTSDYMQGAASYGFAAKSLSSLQFFKYQNVFSKDNLSDKRLVLFGFSHIARDIIDNIGDTVFLICDNDEALWNSQYNGIRIISPDELSTYQDTTVFITAFNFVHDISLQLASLNIPVGEAFKRYFYLFPGGGILLRLKGFPSPVWVHSHDIFQLFKFANRLDSIDSFTKDEESKRVIYHLCSILAGRIIEKSNEPIYSDNIYFPPEILRHLNDNECFLDAGAYDGDTIEKFLRAVNNKFQKIHAFEMNANNFSRLNSRVYTFPEDIQTRICLYNVGVYKESRIIKFHSHDTATTILAEGTSEAKVDKLDDLLKGEKVTFIKMDIEGAEMAALKGAAEIITKQKPKLAISCYHKYREGIYCGSSDLFDIPLFIKSLVPEYDIFIRQHGIDRNCSDTVCYAILRD